MKFRLFCFLLIIPMILMSFELPKNIYKKVAKEIISVYDIEDFALEVIIVSDEINQTVLTKIGSNNLFKILNDSILIGYAFVDKAPSKTDEFDYLVLFDTNLIITKSKVLVYREDYGAEIGSKRWLKQFIGKNTISNLNYGDNIIAISGATISARSMTIAINNLLKTVAVLRKKQII